MKSFTITKNDAGQRVDKFLIKLLPAAPKSLIYKSLRKKRIKVNGKRAQEGLMLQEGDMLEAYINDEFFLEQKNEPDFLSVSGYPDIVYEDENILVMHKPKGMCVHPDEHGACDTLLFRMQRYLYDKGAYDPKKDQTFSPALAHRIDRNTAGLVIGAKNAAALREVCEKIRTHAISKTYLCITCGHLPKKEETLLAYHTKDKTKNCAILSDTPVPGSKKVVTAYRVAKRYAHHDLAEVTLITGKSHQIRAHMAHIGCPLLGDTKYGGTKVPGIDIGQALLAFRIVFDFPFQDSDVLASLAGKTVELLHPALVPPEIEKTL